MRAGKYEVSSGQSVGKWWLWVTTDTSGEDKPPCAGYAKHADRLSLPGGVGYISGIHADNEVQCAELVLTEIKCRDQQMREVTP